MGDDYCGMVVEQPRVYRTIPRPTEAAVCFHKPTSRPRFPRSVYVNSPPALAFGFVDYWPPLMRNGAQQLEGPMAGRVFLDQADLKRRGIVFSNVHLRRLEARGVFPKRIVLGTGRSVAWDE